MKRQQPTQGAGGMAGYVRHALRIGQERAVMRRKAYGGH